MNKKLLVHVRCINQAFEVKTKCLGNFHIKEAHINATILLNYVGQFLLQRKVPLSKVFGFGSDGAGIMTGKGNGVAKQVIDANPFCVAIHCMAHKLNLATSQAANALPFVKNCEKNLTDIFYYFRKSSARYQYSEFLPSRSCSTSN